MVLGDLSLIEKKGWPKLVYLIMAMLLIWP